jgi:RNA polymerase sigma-70 factor (ECF subfamily)
MDRLSDEELMASAQAGDMAALTTLVGRFQAPLTAYLDRLVDPDRALSQDLAQDTFLRVLRQRNLRVDRPLKPWLYAVATNLARDHFKAARVRCAERLDDTYAIMLEEETAGPEDLVVTTERTHTIVAALRRLSPEYRETVLLRFYSDMTLQEIAHALDVPVGAVKSRLWTGLRRLRDLLQAAEAQSNMEEGDRRWALERTSHPDKMVGLFARCASLAPITMASRSG